MGYLPDKLYDTITRHIPIICVDLIPAKKQDYKWLIGIIRRATGTEANKPALLGGRVRYQESLDSAIRRHLKTDCGVVKFQFWHVNSLDRPFYVQQYVHAESAQPPLAYDPTKHSIALTYLIEIGEEPKPGNEADDFYWITASQIPEHAAFNQHVVMAQAFNFLRGPRA